MVATASVNRRGPSLADVDELIACVHDVTKSVLHRVHPALESEGITMAQFSTLHLISIHHPATVSSVARHLSTAAPNVSVDVGRLVAADLVTQHHSQRDRRTVELSLTPEGRKVDARVWEQIGQLVAHAARDLPRERVTMAIQVLRELNQRLGPSGVPNGDGP
jgi:DNA-binding MarR family transcriptional regulator